MRHLILVLLVAVFLPACSTQKGDQPNPGDFKNDVILISFDGLRTDYLDKWDTPNIDRLIKSGVYASEGMIPVYPSLTFPNHYSIVTGLYPAHHGIVSNSMYDPILNARFRISDREALTTTEWWEGEPIWVTAENQGVRTASYYWVGSEGPIKGLQPSYWYTFDDTVPANDRIDQVLAWLDLPDAERPRFIAAYFSDVDHAGHDFGPDAPETREAVERIDRYVGRLLKGLEDRGLFDRINLILVADHGMTQLSRDRVVALDDYIDLNDVFILDAYSILGINPKFGKMNEVYNALKDVHPNMEVYKRADLPDRFKYEGHRRIPEIVGHVDDGWLIVRERSVFEQNPRALTGGAHGYDNQFESMRAMFVAQGPAFKEGITVESFENIELYNLMSHILRIIPAPNDGKPGALSNMLEN